MDESKCPKDFLRHSVDVIHRNQGQNVEHTHTIFYTDEGKKQLENAKVIYMDGTFKVVSKPYVQLLSLHVMVETKDGTRKQYPHLYMLMTRRKKKDYIAVS